MSEQNNLAKMSIILNKLADQLERCVVNETPPSQTMLFDLQVAADVAEAWSKEKPLKTKHRS
jgi:hypothetical protein